MNATHTPDSIDFTARLVANRLLLSLSLDRYPQRLLLVAVDSTAGDPVVELHLSIAAPGMEDREIDQIRQLVRDGLRRTFQPAIMDDQNIGYDAEGQPERPFDNDNAWIHRIVIEPHFETGEPQIVVTMTDPQHLEHKAIKAVLDAVRGLLAETEQETCRQLVILNSSERLVPLLCEVDEFNPTFMKIGLPADLKLRDIRAIREGDSYDDDPVRRAANALENTLRNRLGLDDQFAGARALIATDGSVTLEIELRTLRKLPTARDLNRIEEEVCAAVAKHVRCEVGHYRQLVIVPAFEHEDIADDFGGGGLFDEPVEY